MDASTAQPMIDQVNDAVSQAETLASSTSDPVLRGELVKATQMLRRSELDWSGPQLAQTQDDTRTDENWQSYGVGDDSGSLLNQAKRFIRDNGSVYVQWSAAINTAGDAASAAAAFVTLHLADARKALEGYKVQVAAFDQQEQSAEALAQAMQPVQDALKTAQPEFYDMLFGTPAQDAALKLAAAHTLIEKAEEMIAALESGANAILHNNDIILGQIQAAGFVVAGLIALLALLGTICFWLEGHYQHLGQTGKSDETNKLLAIIADPNASAAAKAAAKKALDALDAEHPPDPLKPFGDIAGDIASIVKTAAYAGGLGIVAYGVWTYRKEIAEKWEKVVAYFKGYKVRAANPRRRRRKNRSRRRYA